MAWTRDAAGNWVRVGHWPDPKVADAGISLEEAIGQIEAWHWRDLDLRLAGFDRDLAAMKARIHGG